MFCEIHLRLCSHLCKFGIWKASGTYAKCIHRTECTRHAFIFRAELGLQPVLPLKPNQPTCSVAFLHITMEKVSHNAANSALFAPPPSPLPLICNPHKKRRKIKMQHKNTKLHSQGRHHFWDKYMLPVNGHQYTQ